MTARTRDLRSGRSLSAPARFQLAWPRPLPVLLVFGFLAACAGNPTVPDTPPPVAAAGPAPRYSLQPGDQLEIKFRYNPELDEQITVQPDGRFSVPMARDVLAAGRTLAEVTDELNQAYSRELRDPAVTVQLRNALPIRVYVGGEVNTPGEYINVGPPLTVVQAIARAGGLKNSANHDRIILVRRGPDGKGTAYGVDYVKAAGGVEEADVQLAPYDTVFVPRSGVANVYLAYQQYIQQFLPANLGFSVPIR
jgi:polysaccharide export outer membrane protein